jgi:hypothetical protein
VRLIVDRVYTGVESVQVILRCLRILFNSFPSLNDMDDRLEVLEILRRVLERCNSADEVRLVIGGSPSIPEILAGTLNQALLQPVWTCLDLITRHGYPREELECLYQAKIHFLTRGGGDAQ